MITLSIRRVSDPPVRVGEQRWGKWSLGFISLGVMQRASHSEGAISAGSLGTAWDLFPLPLRPSVELAHKLLVMVTWRVMNTV